MNTGKTNSRKIFSDHKERKEKQNNDGLFSPRMNSVRKPLAMPTGQARIYTNIQTTDGHRLTRIIINSKFQIITKLQLLHNTFYFGYFINGLKTLAPIYSATLQRFSSAETKSQSLSETKLKHPRCNASNVLSPCSLPCLFNKPSAS